MRTVVGMTRKGTRAHSRVLGICFIYILYVEILVPWMYTYIEYCITEMLSAALPTVKLG